MSPLRVKAYVGGLVEVASLEQRALQAEQDIVDPDLSLSLSRSLFFTLSLFRGSCWTGSVERRVYMWEGLGVAVFSVRCLRTTYLRDEMTSTSK